MKRNLAGLLAVLLFDMRSPPADACGIKLVIKTQTPRKAVARSSNPSHLLLLGTPPHRLERELAAAGHDVEVAATVADAKQSSYAVVVADARQADEARTRFPTATVVVRSGDVSTDIASVESQVARKPVRADEARPVVAAREARRPVAVGPAPATRTVVSAKGAEPEAPPPPARETPPQTVAAAAKPPVEQRPAPAPVRPPPPAPAPAPAPTPAITARSTPPALATHATPAPHPGLAGIARDEIYFGLGSASFGDRHAALDRMVRWLTEHGDVQVVIEGHADPSGTHEGNMVLGQNRAESVRDYLSAAGIDQGRMEVVSFGDTRLKYGRTDPRNRRVAVVPKK